MDSWVRCYRRGAIIVRRAFISVIVAVIAARAPGSAVITISFFEASSGYVNCSSSPTELADSFTIPVGSYTSTLKTSSVRPCSQAGRRNAAVTFTGSQEITPPVFEALMFRLSTTKPKFLLMIMRMVLPRRSLRDLCVFSYWVQVS